MKTLAIFASLCLLAGSPAWADDMQEQQGFPFSFMVDGSSKVTVEQQNKTQVSARLPNGKSQLLVKLEPVDEAAMEGMPKFPVAQVADFNFDGTRDVAILDGNGYGGVNLFYHLYLWDKAKGAFKEFVDKTSGEPGFSNPEVDSAKQTLMTSVRSGPRWFSTEYRSDKGKLYPYMSSEMLSLGEDTLTYLAFKDAAGKVTSHKIIGEIADENAAFVDQPNAIVKIQVDKAWLYDKPNPGSKTKMYVIKGDSVTLLDWKAKDGDSLGGDGWYLVRYQGSKTIEKWLESSTLVQQ